MTLVASQRVFERLKVEPLTPSIGAELSGIDLAEEQDDAVIAEIRAALLAHKVVFFRASSSPRSSTSSLRGVSGR